MNTAQKPAMTAEMIRSKINEFSYWYHKIELPHGIVTPGWAPLKRGASQVVAIDDFSDYLGNLPKDSRTAWQTFDT
jgi:tRNA (mo5U34)-methyltransferase